MSLPRYAALAQRPQPGDRALMLIEADADAFAALLRGEAPRRRRKTDRDLARLEEELAERLGTTVEIRAGKKGGGTGGNTGGGKKKR